ncbi:MAG: RecX family transcriptional regulator [Nitriliruptoraceae bacterium]
MPEDPAPFRDAERWLAERGVQREPLRITPPPAEQATEPVEPVAGTPAGTPGSATMGAREAARLAEQSQTDHAAAEAERQAVPSAEDGLEEDVARAVAFIRRSTSSAPQAEGRIREKLADRDTSERVISLALERARRERLVDDDAMAAALVAEKRAAGHAPARIRRDLRQRGFDDETLDGALADAEREDPEAAAFAVAAERAERLTAVDTETAYRRIVGHVTRRGYPEGLARKVSRQAVFDSRDPQRAAGR